jgi:hypothetical protein
MRLRLVLLLIACAALTAGAVSAPGSDRPQRTVPCSEVIDQVAFPYRGGPERRHRFRQVLGAASVPPAFVEQVSPTRSQPWTHFAKHGLVVRSGLAPLTVTVPRAWRARAGIVWGNGGLGVFHTIRIAACPAEPIHGNAYAGGFFLRQPAACVPLVFISAGRSATVWFGVGRRCPVRSS